MPRAALRHMPLLLTAILALPWLLPAAGAQLAGPSGAGVVFTFDDGSSTHLDAANMLASRGMRGTFYVISECSKSEADVEMCMSDSQVKQLAAAGHDVESHTKRHRDLATLDAKPLKDELAGSRKKIASFAGAPVAHLAYPYGSHTPFVREATATYYATGRIYLTNPAPQDLDVLLAQSGSDPMLIPGLGVTQATSLDRAKAYVEYALSRGVTIVLVFHDITSPPRDEYSWSPGDLASLADYAAARGVPVRTMAQAYGG